MNKQERGKEAGGKNIMRGMREYEEGKKGKREKGK